LHECFDPPCNTVNPYRLKKKWEDITGSVERKERHARQQELKKLNTTGNGFLADEVSCLMYTDASWNFRVFMWQTKWKWWQKNMMTFESSNSAGLYEQ